MSLFFWPLVALPLLLPFMASGYLFDLYLQTFFSVCAWKRWYDRIGVRYKRIRSFNSKKSQLNQDLKKIRDSSKYPEISKRYNQYACIVVNLRGTEPVIKLQEGDPVCCIYIICVCVSCYWFPWRYLLCTSQSKVYIDLTKFSLSLTG